MELGVFKGVSSIELAKALDRHGLGPESSIVSVDTFLLDARLAWAGGGTDTYAAQKLAATGKGYFTTQYIAGGSQMYLEFINNVVRSNMTHRVVPLQSTTILANHAFVAAGFALDAVYVDASHTSVDALVDMTHNWWPLVRCSGIMWGDDYDLLPVRQAVAAFRRKHGLKAPRSAMPGHRKDPGDRSLRRLALCQRVRERQ